MSKISILIAEDHAVVRAGVAALLETEDDLSVVALARNGEEAIREAKRLRPRIVLSDLVMPKASGVAVAEALSRELPDTRVIILTSFSASEGIAHALRAGAAGALMKTDDEQTLIRTIRRVAAGEQVISEEIKKLIQNDPPLPALTPRQRDILESLSRGLTNRDIASQLGIRQDGVDRHVATLLSKIGAANRTEAVAIAIQKQLLKI